MKGKGMRDILSRWGRTVLIAIVAIGTGAALTMASTPAHASGITNHYASKRNISATFGDNSWSTPKYGVSNFAENFVTVGALGGACGGTCGWWEQLSAGDGQLLYGSPAYFDAESVDSPVENWHGYVDSQIVVEPCTSASNVSFDPATCC
jgi:hypothetical protein